MLHVLISLLGVLEKLIESLLFPKFHRFNSGSFIKQNVNKIFHVRFDKVTVVYNDSFGADSGGVDWDGV